MLFFTKNRDCQEVLPEEVRNSKAGVIVVSWSSPVISPYPLLGQKSEVVKLHTRKTSVSVSLIVSICLSIKILNYKES